MTADSFRKAFRLTIHVITTCALHHIALQPCRTVLFSKLRCRFGKVTHKGRHLESTSFLGARLIEGELGNFWGDADRASSRSGRCGLCLQNTCALFLQPDK
jgi:hypothetical protein